MVPYFPHLTYPEKSKQKYIPSLNLKKKRDCSQSISFSHMAVAEEKTRDLLFCGNHLGKRENTGDEVEDSDDIITLLTINLYLCAI